MKTFSYKIFVKELFVLLLLTMPATILCQQNPKHEMRAVWLATVSNIDWPSTDSLTTEEQKEELLEILDLVKKNNMNTVIFQIRPSTDAFYVSKLEPWSVWLTGQQGKAPDPFYDPLEFTIKECRKRGLDIHVWLNPYRAVADTSIVTSTDHITNVHPEWFLTYGKTKYFNPGLDETRNHVSRVVSDIVRRYDIDAVHMDDYFYPYRIKNIEFPDSISFKKYPRGFSPEQKDAWRRDNVDLIIKQIHDSIRAIKPWVEFGISPFGVWRNSKNDPNGSNTMAGVTNYDDLYADILKWQKEGWIDYVVPQLYWHIGFEIADYEVLTNWWSHNTYGSQLYIGQALYRLDKRSKTKEWRSSKQIIRQIENNRSYPNIKGSVFFSAKHLKQTPLNITNKLSKKIYSCPSLSPVNKRITPIIPESPINASITINGNVFSLDWEKGENVKKFVVYRYKKGELANLDDSRNIYCITSENSLSFDITSSNNPLKYDYVVTSQSYTNLESAPVYFKENLTSQKEN